MSLTRNAINELCSFVQERSSSVFGSKFWDCRLVCGIEYGTKPDKYENRIFALSKFRVFILHGKTPQSLKIDRAFHILSIRVIQIVNDNENNQLSIVLDESFLGKRRIFIRVENSARNIGINFLSAIKHYFPDIHRNLRCMLDLSPSELYEEFQSLPNSRPYLPCHNFRRSYAALCDFYDQPFREEVVWDIEKIYSTHGIHILRLDDFSHLLSKDLLPIMATCQFSSYFTGLYVDGIKLFSELIEVILSILRVSSSLTTLILRNCSLPREFIASFVTVIQHNPNLVLEELDFSKNILDEKKGFASFGASLSKISSLRSLTLSECVLSEKSLNLISSGLLQGIKSSATSECRNLVKIDFSGNSLKDDMIDLMNLLSLCNTLRILNLSDTGINIDKLWTPLTYGGLQLENLMLSGCHSGRRTRESAQQMKKYFSTAVSLKHIDFTNTFLHTDLLKALLLGLASNQQLKPFILLLNGVCDRSSLSVLETCLSGVDAWYLSLKDNAMEAELLPIVVSISHMKHLTKLDLSGANFPNSKRSTKNAAVASNILLEIVKLIGEDDSHLSELSIADCRLGSHLSVLLNTLGVASSLQFLDISGNEIGNFGARLLAKALQINISLKTVSIDRNQITCDGFADIAHSLKLNYSLVSLPFPAVDAAESMNRADRNKTLSALSEIEMCIKRNRTGSLFPVAHYHNLIGAAKHELETHRKGDDSSGSFDELMNSLNSLPLNDESDPSFERISVDLISRLDEVALEAVKKTLGPVLKVTDKNVIHEPQLLSSPIRSNLIRTIDIYLNEIKWKSVSRIVQSVVNDFHKQNADDERGVFGYQNGNNESDTTMNSSDAAKLITQSIKSHRPKSFITDVNDGLHDVINFELPPVPSPLIHVAKNRPKPIRNRKNSSKKVDENVIDIDNSGDDHIDEKVVCDGPSNELTNSTSNGSGKVLPPRRAAILPPQESAPPILPRRNRIGTAMVPPTLPPKPEQITMRPVSCNVNQEDETASSARKSVADMARLFSSTDTPFSRRV